MSIYNIPIRSIDGEENALLPYEGKVTLMVNVSSKAGYDPKCSKFWSYARTCRFFEKVDLNGKNEHPLFSALKGNEKRNYSDTAADQSEAAQKGQNLAGQAIARISHGYEKFIVSGDGRMISRFNWQDMPLDEIPRVMGAGWTIREALDEILG